VAVEADGRTPLPRASIRVYSDDAGPVQHAWASADEKGEFVLRDLPATKLRLAGFWSESKVQLRTSRTITPATPQPIALVLLGLGSLRVSLVDARTGGPVTRARIVMIGPEDPARGIPRTTDSNVDPAGQAAFERLDPGVWDLNLTSTSRAPRWTSSWSRRARCR